MSQLLRWSQCERARATFGQQAFRIVVSFATRVSRSTDVVEHLRETQVQVRTSERTLGCSYD